jgi:hypothetical protein
MAISEQTRGTQQFKLTFDVALHSKKGTVTADIGENVKTCGVRNGLFIHF